RRHLHQEPWLRRPVAQPRHAGAVRRRLHRRVAARARQAGAVTMSGQAEQHRLTARGIGGKIANTLRLAVKELRSIRADPILVALIPYTFSVAIYSVASGAKTEAENMAIAVVDEDRSALSRRLRDAFLPPLFKTPVEIGADEIDAAMDA